MLKLKTKEVLREILPQRLDEELDAMDEEQATDEIMQSALDKGFDDNSRKLLR